MRVLFMGLIMVFALTVNTFGQTDLAEKYFEEGTNFAKEEKYEKAIESYEKSLNAAKRNKKLKSKIQYNIGVGLYHLKKFDEAESAFNQAIKGNKKYVQAIYSLGLTQIELEKLSAAESSFRKVIRLDNKHAEAWFDLGMVLLERKKFQNAKVAFQQSIKYKTTRLAEAQNNLGVISASAGNIDLAVTQFQVAFSQSKGKLLLAKKNIEFCERFKHLELNRLLAIK